MNSNIRNTPQATSQRPLTVMLSVGWHLLLSAFLIWLSLTIFQMEQLTILGKQADLGKPVQYFSAVMLLVPVVLAILGTVLMFQRNNDGRYLALIVNFGGFALSAFALIGIWGFFDSFERIVDMVLANGQLALIGLAGAYALYWLVGRLNEDNRIREYGEMIAIGLAMLTIIIMLFRGTIGNDEFASFNVLNGIIYALTRYTDANSVLFAWGTTISTVIFAYFSWQLLHLGDYFGETPDQRNAWQGWFMLAPNIIGFLLFFAGPLLLSLYLSFTDGTVGQPPNFNGLANYAQLMSLEMVTTTDSDIFAQSTLSRDFVLLGELNFQNSDGEGTRYIFGAKDRMFWISLRNTLLFCLMLLPLSVIPAIGMALILNSKLPGVKFFRAVYFLPSVAAVVGTALIWRWLYTPTTGYIDYALTVIWRWFGQPAPEIGWLSDPQWVLFSIVILAAWQVVGYNTVLVLAGLQGIPNTLYEAAQIDGANKWKQFWNVTLPMLQPTLFFVMITTMVTGLQVFNEPYTLFPARPIPENAVTSVYYMYLQGFNQFNFGYASSVAWVLFVIIFGLTLIQFRLNRNEAYE
ncbi:MAG: carbohydrate ABC transporter permease [Anaerolineae bacterium]